MGQFFKVCREFSFLIGIFFEAAIDFIDHVLPGEVQQSWKSLFN